MLKNFDLTIKLKDWSTKMKSFPKNTFSDNLPNYVQCSQSYEDCEAEMVKVKKKNIRGNQTQHTSTY